MSAEFEGAARAALDRMVSELEAVGADFEEKGDGVIEVELDDGAKVIVNRHSAAQEIWVASRSGGFHYRWDGAQWRNTRDGSELFASVKALLAG